MRYIFKPKIVPTIGDRQIITKFLLIPKILNHELRWLETVRIEQEYKTWKGYMEGVKHTVSYIGWCNIDWAN